MKLHFNRCRNKARYDRNHGRHSIPAPPVRQDTLKPNQHLTVSYYEGICSFMKFSATVQR